MASKLPVSLPSISFIGKTVLTIVLVMLVVRMTPDTWGIKKYFSPV